MNSKISTILIIDDDPLVLMNNTDILEDAGYAAVSVSNSVQAWNTLKDRDFELIICDHDLGDGKGIDIIKRMIAAGKDIPVIYLSAALPQVLEEVARLAPVKKVLSKPVSREVLLGSINEFKKDVSDTQKTGGQQFIGLEERKMLLENPLFSNKGI